MRNNCYNYGPIGERIKQVRNARNYTQAELAEMIDINTKNVSSLERGMMGLSVPTLISICEALDVSADYILFGSVEDKEKDTISILMSELSEDKKRQAEKLLEVFVDAYRE